MQLWLWSRQTWLWMELGEPKPASISLYIILFGFGSGSLKYSTRLFISGCLNVLKPNLLLCGPCCVQHRAGKVRGEQYPAWLRCTLWGWVQLLLVLPVVVSSVLFNEARRDLFRGCCGLILRYGFYLTAWLCWFLSFLKHFRKKLAWTTFPLFLSKY